MASNLPPEVLTADTTAANRKTKNEMSDRMMGKE